MASAGQNGTGKIEIVDQVWTNFNRLTTNIVHPLARKPSIGPCIRRPLRFFLGNFFLITPRQIHILPFTFYRVSE